MFDVRSLTVPGVVGVDHASERWFLPKLQDQIMATPSLEHACVPGVVIVQIFSSCQHGVAFAMVATLYCTRSEV